MPPISTDLKKAILELSPSEKDKLLLKLVAKDSVLCEKLAYQLLEAEATLEDRRADVHDEITDVLKASHYSPGWLMMDLRRVNARITHHVKITKDKYGEVSLTLFMLNGVFDYQMPYIQTYERRNDTLSVYVAKRTQFVLQKLIKLHPDLHIEFADDVNRLLTRLHAHASARYAKELHLPKAWEG